MNGWNISYDDTVKKITDVLQTNLISKDILTIQNILISEDRDLNLIFKNDSSMIATFRIWIESKEL